MNPVTYTIDPSNQIKVLVEGFSVPRDTVQKFGRVIYEFKNTIDSILYRQDLQQEFDLKFSWDKQLNQIDL